MSLTKNDLGQIAKIVTKTIDSANNELRNELRLEIISATSGLKLEIDDAKQELRQEMQTWRSEFFDKIDPILQEVTTNRDERSLITHDISKHSSKIKNHEKRISKLEVISVGS